ncbi:MAG: hypothetical protein KDC67_16615 [Ignavibacteriae bacterium]|nr:hypothetical protein [Ignavibacteriota bacterium]
MKIRNGAEYDNDLNKGYYYENDLLIATLLFDNDCFEYHYEGHTQEDKDMMYEEMTTAKSRWMYNAKMS